MLRKDLLDMLVCPEHRTPLTLADERMVAAVNRAIAAGRVKDRRGVWLKEAIDAGLLRDDRTILYPVIDDIPKMLPEDGIPLDQVEMEP